MIPTTLGNIVGGGLFVGTAYWYLYLTGEGGVSVDFNLGNLESAMQAGGGPMRPGKGVDHHEGENDQTMIHGHDPTDRNALPHSAGHMMSGLGAELSDDSPYTKTHAERIRSESSEDKADEKV